MIKTLMNASVDKGKILRLVRAVQNGDDCMDELWTECHAYITFETELYMQFRPEPNGQIKEDLMQESFFALLAAIQNFHPDGADFLSVLDSALEEQWSTMLS